MELAMTGMQRGAAGWTVILAAALVAAMCAAATGAEKETVDADSARRAQWWREAKFGMFIHWGLYAIPAGQWTSGEVSRNAYSEWIMHALRIPVADYEKLAGEFNPVRFDAEAWVKLAKSTGMKYIVITAKHHDGFSMFDSKVTKYDIVDATPFQRDPMKELAAACRKHGMKLGFYYSVDRDWHHPDAQGNELKQSNDWDYPDEGRKDFDKYLRDFAMPQLRELLTNYGPVAIIWFDGIGKKTAEQNEAIIDLIRKLQPDCLINSRLGDWKKFVWGDYRSMGDNQASNRDLGYGWENPGTMNRSYAYNKGDHRWRPREEIIGNLVSIASNGGNYLLNIGPKADGTVPAESVKILGEVGKWMAGHGESIYGSSSAPAQLQLPRWARCTARPGRLYVHLLERPGDRKLEIGGVKAPIKAAYMLADAKKSPLKVAASPNGQVVIDLPAAATDPSVSTVVLEVDAQ